MMGTRGAIAFVVDGEEKVAYNHFDSYPDGVGVDVLNWIRGVVNANDDLAVKEQVRSLTVVNEDDAPTPQQVESLNKYARIGVGGSQASIQDWYGLLRETQGDPAAILDSGFIIDASEFPLDSLFCEWAYVIDFDRDAFEVYKGFVHAGDLVMGRWANRLTNRDGYHPVTLVQAWDFYDLPDPSEFVTTFYDESEDD